MHLLVNLIEFLRSLFNPCRVFCVKFSHDGTYIISGSDDTNLRLWKATASQQLGVVSTLFFFNCAGILIGEHFLDSPLFHKIAETYMKFEVKEAALILTKIFTLEDSCCLKFLMFYSVCFRQLKYHFF